MLVKTISTTTQFYLTKRQLSHSRLSISAVVCSITMRAPIALALAITIAVVDTQEAGNDRGSAFVLTIQPQIQQDQVIFLLAPAPLFISGASAKVVMSVKASGACCRRSLQFLVLHQTQRICGETELLLGKMVSPPFNRFQVPGMNH